MAFLSLFTQNLLPQNQLVSTGAVWKYLDNGADLGTNWMAKDYDDGGWAAGSAPLGYGDGDEATILQSNRLDGTRIITTYFRQGFVLKNAGTFTNLSLRLLRDDAGVVYLNGIEIFRSNLTSNDITFTTLAYTNVSAADEGTNFYATAVDPALLSEDLNLLGVEIHQISTNSSDVSFDLALTGNYEPVPPAVRILSPADGALLSRGNATINATASDSLGSVMLVEFFGNGTKLGEDSTAPYSLTWPNIPLGSHTFTAVAVNNSGLSATSGPVTITVLPSLIHSASEWKYLDDGSNQGTLWRELAFDDSGWSNGVAELGYGDGGEATVIGGGPDTNGVITAITTYFRHVFDVADTSAFSNLVLRLLRDDGGIVYLNGMEIFRSDMPQGPPSFDSFAAGIINLPQESQFYSTNVPVGLLVAGSNVVAVEIHQGNDTSSDLSFNLELLPNIPPASPTINMTGPTNNATFFAPATVTMSAEGTDFDGTIARVDFLVGNAAMGMDVTEPYSLTASNLAEGNYELKTIATDYSGLATTSAPVSVTVLNPPLMTALIPTGAVWRYLDDGSNQGTNWVRTNFNDNGWSVGTAKFGTNDVAVTSIRIGPTNITAYFRHFFHINNAGAYTNLGFRVLRDDGVAAYLNGAEVFRMNMPAGPINYMTPVSSTQPVGGTNESYYFPTNISAASLNNGWNLLAVELHQTSTTTDAGFDLVLTGIGPPGPPPISLTIGRSGTDIIIQWTDNGAILESAGSPAGPWSTVMPLASSPYIAAPTGGTQFYRLRKP